MSQFDWQTDEEIEWETDEASATRPTASWHQQRQRMLLLAILALLVGLVVALEARRRVAEVTDAIEQDVNASFDLLTQVVIDQDQDLFVSLLSGQNAAWSNVQLAFLRSGSLFQREAFDLQAAGTPRIADVTLSPDLTSAELTIHTPYQAGTNIVTLAQTTVFRQGTTHWLYAPPAEAFWGDMKIVESDHLSIIYSERDEAIVTQLFNDLSQRMGVPTTAFGNFQAEQVLQIELSTDPQTLLRRPRREQNLLTLPTPTLFGLPTDDAGYELLLSFYSRHIFSLPYTI